MMEYLNIATTPDSANKKDLSAVLKNFTATDFSMPTYSYSPLERFNNKRVEYLQNHVHCRIADILKGFISIKNFASITVQSGKHCVDYVTDNGFVINNNYVPCNREEDLQSLSLISKKQSTVETDLIANCEDEIKYAKTLEVSNGIVQHLAKADKNLSGTDGSGK